MTLALPGRAPKLRPPHWLTAPNLAMSVHHTRFLSVHSLCAGGKQRLVGFQPTKGRSLPMPRSAAKTATPAIAPSEPLSSPSGFKVVDRVSHQKFGNGVVKAIDADKLTIQFSRNVVKEIVDYYVKHR